jgi:hypothetical protein
MTQVSAGWVWDVQMAMCGYLHCKHETQKTVSV